ncbi:unnamed protein product [Caenorhabditis bovis]|uniref:ZP domain-containing protein n=1 Tax=Caenorhabditis bovis TaxID=2654633 RepID=A0A8S1F4B2_9PELO|nr:unnamed protein product [Caenorhabditis bovis]
MLPRLCFALLIFAQGAQQFAIENGVVGKPEVHCGIDNIRVNVNTEHPFTGRIYVDGESDKQHCVHRSEDSHEGQQFGIPIGACNMRRQRTLHPRGIAFSFTMIVSFHPFFVTGMDRAFSIRCFFLESIKGLNAEIDVGTLAPQSVDQEYSLPVCAYHLKEGVEGHVLRFAQVGQKVTHVWRCDQDASHVYGILIHSCFADDGHGNKFELVDDRGCSTDPFLLPQIEYEPNAISAFTNAHVFKYADKVQLYFTCTVQLCYKHDGGCEGITPPSCGIDHHSHHASSASQERSSEEHPNEPPKFAPHIPEPEIFGPPTGGLNRPAFQPIILGQPNPFNEGGHHPIPPFRGPKPMSNEDNSRSAYRRDSPLNETDVSDEEEIVMQVVTARTTISTPQRTPELVTFKPLSSNGKTEGTSTATPTTTSVQEPLTTTASKKRRTSGDMETDVSVDVIVLPVEDNDRKDGAVPPQSLSFSVSPEVCVSRTASGIMIAAIILALFCCSTVTFFVTRQRNRDYVHKRRIDNF